MKDEKNIPKNNKRFFKFGFLVAAIVIILIIFGAINFFVTGNVISGIQDNNNIQIVKLTVQGSNYVLEPSTIKMGIPVRMEADMSKVVGCSNSIVISAFNIRKTVTNSDNILEFTPDKAGKFNIACSMNMYRGTFTVLDSEGKTSEYVEPLPTGGHTCGASSGGCGCGG